MSKKLLLPVTLLILFSFVLGACAPAAAPAAPAEVQPTVAVAQPTAVPPTEVPPTEVPVVAPDMPVLLKDVIAKTGQEQGYGAVAAQKLNEMLADQPPFLVDLREPAELEKDGYIEGAVNIPVRDLLKNLDKLPGLDEPIVVYCASGHRGGFALTALKLMGYTNVVNLGGGLNAWKKAEFAVATGAPAAPEAISTPIVEDQALYTLVDEFLTNIPEGFAAMGATAVNEALASGETLTLVDIRREDEVAKNGYIEGAVFLPMETILDNLDQLPTDQKIIIYCGSGQRGGIIITALRMLGYDAYNMGGGIGAWKAAQLPLEGVVDWNAVWGDFITNIPAGFYSKGAADVNTMLTEGNVTLVDVREAAELEKTGYIQGAIHIPVRDLLKNLDKLPAQDETIIIYCASGHRGGLAMAALRLLGYTEVYNLGGGTGAWAKASLPLETGLPAEAEAGTAPEVDPIRFADLDAFLTNMPEGFYTVSAANLNAELAEAAPFMLDVRTPEEVTADGYIEGATLIPVNEMFTQFDKLPTDKSAKIVVLCKSGHRGSFAMMALRMLGYTDVRNLGGGLNAWIAAELPVVKQ